MSSRYELVRSRVRLRLESDCWDWLPARDSHGYGQIRVDGPKQLSHRVAWEAVYGPIPEGMEVCHSCDNPRCCNPDHLFDGTQQDNVADMMSKGRGRKARGEEHGSAKLTSEQIRWIREVYRPRHHMFGGRALARQLNVSDVLVHLIAKQAVWKHLLPLV